MIRWDALYLAFTITGTMMMAVPPSQAQTNIEVNDNQEINELKKVESTINVQQTTVAESTSETEPVAIRSSRKNSMGCRIFPTSSMQQ